MLTQTAEYALRAMGALAARKGQTIPATELASQADVPPPYLAKIMQRLASTELVTGRRGIGGGYTLKVDPDEVTALDVIKAVSPIREPSRASELDVKGDGFAGLDRVIGEASNAVIRVFDGVKLSAIVQDADAVRREQDYPVGVISTSSNGTAGGGANGRTNGSANGEPEGEARQGMAG